MQVTEFTDKWVSALRSGEYEQGTTFLNRDGKFCCLGVGIDVLGCEWVAGYDEPEVLRATDNNNYSGSLSAERRAQLGITENEMVDLYRANDSDGKTFAEIADAIEAAKTSGEIKF